MAKQAEKVTKAPLPPIVIDLAAQTIDLPTEYDLRVEHHPHNQIRFSPGGSVICIPSSGWKAKQV